MELPTKKTQPRVNLANLSILIHGMPKVGKTTWCAGADNALFLATEPGLNSIEVYQMPISAWEEMMEACALIADGKHSFQTIVIDTVDNAYKMCSKYICDKHKIDHESDLGYGRGYAFINNEFQRAINKLASLPYGLYMISHSQEKEIETRTGKYTRIIPTLPEKIGKIIVGMVDMILYCTIEVFKDTDGQQKNKRVMKTKPNLYYEAGDRTGRLPEEIDLDYKAFLKEFKGSAVSGKDESKQEKQQQTSD